MTDFFFKNKKISKIIFKIFFDFFFFRKLTEFQLNFLSNIKKLPKLFLQFFSIFFSKNFFYVNFFLQIFFLVKIFISNFFFWENFFFHRNISFVFDVSEIFYSKFCLLRICCFAILVYGKFLFSAMNVNTKFGNVSFLKKSKIFSDRTFGFLYSLLRKY